jgi:inner membrane protein
MVIDFPPYIIARHSFYTVFSVTISAMTARTHDVAAITALLVIVLAFGPESLRLSTLLLAVLANQIGGITPDIDQPTAPLWHNLPEGHVIGRVFDKLLGGHRFISHSILGLALFGWLSYLLLHFLHPIMPNVDIQLVWYAFLIGYISHLVMDTLTKEGVPWLLPIPVKFGVPPVKHLRITTGKWVETLVVLPLLIAFDLWLCWGHYDHLVLLLHHVMS